MHERADHAVDCWRTQEIRQSTDGGVQAQILTKKVPRMCVTKHTGVSIRMVNTSKMARLEAWCLGLGVLDEEYHKESDNGSAGIDDQLPAVGVAKV